MGLILLIAVGGILGWLASIVLRIDDRQGVLLNVSVGIAGALVAGLISSEGSILSGLSAFALLVALAGAFAMLVLANILRGRQSG